MRVKIHLLRKLKCIATAILNYVGERKRQPDEQAECAKVRVRTLARLRSRGPYARSGIMVSRRQMK